MPEPQAAVGRSLWSGSLSFGLVTVPVELYSGTRAAGVPLRMLGPDGVPLARQYVCPEDGKVLSGDDLERGAEVGDDEFVIVGDEELEALAPRRSRDMSLERFVPREDVDPAYFVRAYFLVPGQGQSKAYRLLADTMEAKGRAALASFVMRGRSHAVAVFADRGILRAQTLRFGDELRTPQDLGLPEPRKPQRKRVSAMAREVKRLEAARLDPSELSDPGASERLALAERKRERGEDVYEVGEAAVPEDEEGGGEVVDLMALLRQRMRERPARAGRRSGRDAQGRGSGRGAKRGDALANATKQELYERARELDLPGRSRMSRDELLASLRKAG